MSSDKYENRKKYLNKMKQLRVWMNPEKYEQFKALVEADGKSVYSVINEFVDDYIEKREPPR